MTVKGKGEMVTYFIISQKAGAVFPDHVSSPATSPESPYLSRPSSRESRERVPLMRQNSSSAGVEVVRHPVTAAQARAQSLYGAIGLERKPSIESQRGNAPTPPGSLNKKRKINTDSPRESSNRNPLRKLSNSSLTNCLSGDVSYSRVDSPELPAVHYMNIKMHSSSLPRNNVQNSIFDSLKSTNSSVSENTTVNEDAYVPISPPTSTKPLMSPVKKLLHGPSGKPPLMSNPQSPVARVTPIVLAGVVPTFKEPIKPVSATTCMQYTSDTIMNNHVANSNHKELPNKEINAMNSMLKELGQVMSTTEAIRPYLKPSQRMPHNQSNLPTDNMVIGTYKEPIDFSYNALPRKRTSMPVEQKPNFLDLDRNSNKHGIKTSLDLQRTPSESRSSSSRSTITPTSALVANIDGLNMSILPVLSQENYAPLQRIPSEVASDMPDKPEKKRPNVKPAVPNKPSSIFQSSQLRYIKALTSRQSSSDDDKDSTSSRQMSENSSIVQLHPIELKSTGRLQGVPSHGWLFHSGMGKQWRSSETLSSISRQSPPTPKFPLMSSSGSFNQLLQELSGISKSSPYTVSSKPPTSGARNKNNEKPRQNGIRGKPSPPPPMHPVQASDVVKALVSPRESLPPGKRFPRPKASFAWQPRHSPSPQASPELTRPPANPFQVKRRQNYNSIPPRHCRSLDYIPSDREEAASSNASSAADSPKSKQVFLFPFHTGLKAPITLDNISISSIASSSEMSRSDPAINFDSGSAAYESEYDNYRPGMASDEDYFMPEPISDVDIDYFDDINIDNVTVSDSFRLDLPIRGIKQKKITDV